MSKGKLYIWRHTWRAGSDNGSVKYSSMICYQPVPSSDDIWGGMGHLTDGMAQHLKGVVKSGYKPVFDRDPDGHDKPLTEDEKQVLSILA